MQRILLLCFTFLMTSCSLLPPESQDVQEKLKVINEYDGDTQQALFAGGCFWCVESAFEYVDGVVAAISGYAGGEIEDPTYEQVSSGTTGHKEVVLVIFDPAQVTYEQLVEYFWKQIDPTDAGGSFVDRGSQYTSAIYYDSPEQKRIAEASKQNLEASGKYSEPIATEILPATSFYPAEEYHQDYYKKSPLKYRYYRSGSGRDDYLKKVWGEDTSHGF